MTRMLLSVWVLMGVAVLRGAAPIPRDLGPRLQEAQEQLQHQRPHLALQLLQSYQGDDHALRQLLLGHAFAAQINTHTHTNADANAAAALAAYRRALQLDPALDAARQGLAHLHARQEQWADAAALLAQFVSPWTAEADWLTLYAQAALALDDPRLAQTLTEAGLVRFPGNRRLRQLDLTRLVRTGAFAQARTALRHLLRAEPASPQLWEQLAAVALQGGLTNEYLPALEAALLADSENLERHRQFLASLLQEGDWLSAVEHGQRLLAGRLARPASRRADIVELLIRAADDGGREDWLARWLALVPETQRTPAMRLAEARSALRQGRPAQARDALRRLIASGDTRASVFLWAGSLAESEGALAEAEAHYRQAASQSEPAATLAPLHLARLLHSLGRQDEAARVLRQHLEQHPEDVAARALLAACARDHRAADASSDANNPP
ncbi:MAG: tetratricopeptide repeat protein [Verrucomicrobia bacterium]|nr:tetratricopeptide repeat protein [Verrucomicrobiota bacterium]